MADEIIVRIKAEGSEKFIKELKDAGIQVEKTTKQAQKSVTSLQDSVKKFAAFAGVTFGALAIRNFVTQSVNAFKEFDASIKDLQAITGLAGEDLAKLEENARKMSAQSTKSAAEVLTAFKLIGSAKPEILGNTEALSELTEAAITLSEASGLTLEQAATNLGNSLNALQLPAEEAGRLINVLAAASQKGAKEIPFVADALSKFGGVASSAGVSVEESVAAVETLGKAIPEASIVGNNLKNILLILQIEAQKSGREFGSLSEELDLLAPSVNDVSKLVKLFGRESLLAAQTLIAQRDEFKNLTEAITGTNTAYEQQAIINSSLDAQLKKFRNTVEGFQVQAGNLLKEALIPIIATFTAIIKLLQAAPKFIKENIVQIGLLTAALIAMNRQLIATRFTGLTTSLKSIVPLFRLTRFRILRYTVALRRARNATLALARANPIGLTLTALALGISLWKRYQNRVEKAQNAQFEWLRQTEDVVPKITEAEDKLKDINKQLETEEPGSDYWFFLQNEARKYKGLLEDLQTEQQKIIDAGENILAQTGVQLAFEITGQDPSLDVLDTDVLIANVDKVIERARELSGEAGVRAIEAVYKKNREEARRSLAFFISENKERIDELNQEINKGDFLSYTDGARELDNLRQNVKDAETALKAFGTATKEVNVNDILDGPGGETKDALGYLESLKAELKQVTDEIAKLPKDSPLLESKLAQIAEIETKIKNFTTELEITKAIQDSLFEKAKITTEIELKEKGAERVRKIIKEINEELESIEADQRDREIKGIVISNDAALDEAKRIGVLVAQLEGLENLLNELDPLISEEDVAEVDANMEKMVDNIIKRKKEMDEALKETTKTLTTQIANLVKEVDDETDKYWKNFFDNQELIRKAFKDLSQSINIDVEGGFNASGAIQTFQNIQKQFEETNVGATDFQKTIVATGASLQVFGDIQNTIGNTRLKILEQQREQGRITEQEFARRTAEIERKKAIFNKATALSQIAINTAVAVTNQIKTNPALAAFIIAIGAAQAAIVAAQPIPSIPGFRQGTEYVERGNNKRGIDTIPAMLNEGERIITSETNSLYRDELNLIQRGIVKPGQLKRLYDENKAFRKMFDYGDFVNPIMSIDQPLRMLDISLANELNVSPLIESNEKTRKSITGKLTDIHKEIASNKYNRKYSLNDRV